MGRIAVIRVDQAEMIEQLPDNHRHQRGCDRESDHLRRSLFRI